MTAKDTAQAVAHDPRAPEPERQQALTELQKAAKPSSVSDLLPSPEMLRFIKHVQKGMDDEEMRKAEGGAKIIPFPNSYRGRQGAAGGMKSVYLDEFQINAMGDFYDKPGGMAFDAMRQMVEQTPILGAVMMTRIRQVQRFCQIQENDDGPGFFIKPSDPSYKPTKDDRKQQLLLAKFFNNCGWEFNPRARRRLHRDNLSSFLAKAVRDSLTMDSMPIETEYKRDKNRGIDGFYAVDGSTIRLCTEQGYEGDDQIYALQVIAGRIRTAYTLDDLIYEVRNPRADVRLAGYGLAETELLVRVVTGLLNAMTLNIKGFSDNAIPQGILTLIGDYGEEDLNAFKRYWSSMVRGVNNRWSMPVMAAQNTDSKAVFEKIDTGFDDMYFSKWMTFLTSIICALYCMSPEEINFESFADNKSSMSGNDTEEKLAKSTDKGLRPLLTYLETTLSDFICSDFSDKWVFRWTGMEEEDAEKRHEMRKLTQTVDEARKEEGQKPMESKLLGGAPLNPALIPLYTQEQQQKQMAQQNVQGEGGDQGALDFGQPANDAQGGDGGEDEDAPAAGGDKGQPGKAGPQRAAAFSKALPASHRVGWG